MHENSAAKAEQKKANQEQVLKKIRQLENRQKILLNRQSDMERRARTRRLISMARFWSSVFPALTALPGEEIKAFLLTLSHLPGVPELPKPAAENGETG